MSLDLLYKWKEGSRPSGKPRGTSFQSSLPTRTSPLLSSLPLGNHSSLLSTVIPKGSTPAIHPTANHETSFKTLGSCLSPKNIPLPADGLEKMSYMNKCASWDEIVVGVRLYVLNIHIASSSIIRYPSFGTEWQIETSKHIKCVHIWRMKSLHKCFSLFI